ncbi:MAG: hypothetical protein OEZ58_20300 [Gammaproteobacteria bacterium]|nr:hypothetical protein [Gammaproteobacteria bacterium]MDH5731334.1 hypothetical protein [Gammaproteobacteria bacterium]
MKKITSCALLYCILSFGFSPNLSANERSSVDSIYFLGYGGLLTIGYQRLLHNRIGVNIQVASIALLHKDLRDAFVIPAVVSFYPLGDEHRWFIDIGRNYISKGKSNPLFDFFDGPNRPYIIGTGYNFHPKHGGRFIKAGLGLFIYQPASTPQTYKTGVIGALAYGKSF